MKKIEINIEPYIQDYEARKIKSAEIAQKEGVSASTVARRIRMYYKNENKEHPFTSNHESNKKKIDVERYIKELEEGNITIKEIAIIEGISHHTIGARIKEYYEKNGMPKPNFKKDRAIKKVNIEQYIEDYEAGKITATDIEKKSGVSYSTIYARIKEYYEKNGMTKPNFKKGRAVKKVNIEPYISDYEAGNITQKQISEKEEVNVATIARKINTYLTNNNLKYVNKLPKNVEDAIKSFLKRGMSKDSISEIAGKRGIVITDEVFERLSKEITVDEKERE